VRAPTSALVNASRPAAHHIALIGIDDCLIADHSASPWRLNARYPGFRAVSIPRVLVADDNPLSLQFFRDALAELGVDCVAAADGMIALEQAGRDAFDLLLLDACMPGLGGAETLAGIRARRGPSQHATALATTAHDDVAMQTALLATGFAAVLAKPLGLDTLRTALDRYLPAGVPRAATNRREWFDEGHALAAAGGDHTIAAALRGLLVRELELLPTELDGIGERRDAHALRERLHRLDASAGFCGVSVLARAGSALRVELDAPGWPAAAIARFLDTCSQVHAMLGQTTSASVVDSRAT
jgi:CheY-like chemotaxis protein